MGGDLMLVLNDLDGSVTRVAVISDGTGWSVTISPLTKIPLRAGTTIEEARLIADQMRALLAPERPALHSIPRNPIVDEITTLRALVVAAELTIATNLRAAKAYLRDALRLVHETESHLETVASALDASDESTDVTERDARDISDGVPRVQMPGEVEGNV